MKYRYLYQTKENVVREGFVNARDRADAYTILRKQGLRPMRVIGDDPIRWQPWAIGVAFLLLIASLAFFIFHNTEETELPRSQLVGSSQHISNGIADGWASILPTKLDCYLAAYAQPGWLALPPEVSEDEINAFQEDLKKPFEIIKTLRPEEKQLMYIVARMRSEMVKYLEDGGNIKGYLDFLEERQNQEREFRSKAVSAVERAPESMRETARLNMNVRLREMGLPEIETTNSLE